MNIIIVDDDPFVTGALKTILESTGEITVKATGTDGKVNYMKNISQMYF